MRWKNSTSKPVSDPGTAYGRRCRHLRLSAPQAKGYWPCKAAPDLRSPIHRWPLRGRGPVAGIAPVFARRRPWRWCGLPHARSEMLPRLMGQRIELDRAFGELRAVERDASTQHATQVFAGLEHLLEDRLALAQGRIRINATTGRQCQAGEQYNSQFFKSHGGFEVTGKRRPVSSPRP